MKSRISYFDKTIFKKNLTRFAPAWGLYTVCALMGLVLWMDSGYDWIVSHLIESIQIMSIITPCYALLCAQLLFGDLYNSRMCNALHALPLRRETWLGTNVLSGFAFHLIPTAIFTVLAFVLLAITVPAKLIWAAPIWFVGVNLQFMCFFGIAVLCAFCVGSRFAQAVVYIIVNFASVIAAWLLETLYIPQLYGIKLNYTPFLKFSPIANMMEAPFMIAERVYDESRKMLSAVELHRGDHFAYYFIAAAIGIALLFLAMRIYRRRDLECAGDFMSVKGLEPVFLVIYTLIVGAVFYFITETAIGMDTVFFLFVGLAVGWFTGRMLLERTPRVFHLKSFLGCGALMAACALTLIAAALDPFGIESWVPEAEQVESVGISEYWYSPGNVHEDITLTDPEDIQTIIGIHQEAVDFYEKFGTAQFRIETAETTAQPMDKEALEEADRMNFRTTLTFVYHMKNGRTVNRYYEIWMGDDTGEVIRRFFSSPETVFRGMTEEQFLEETKRLVIQESRSGEEYTLVSREDIQGLCQAILADCEAGTMAQAWIYHHPDENIFWIYSGSDWNINVFSNAENTLNWLHSYGIDVDALLEKQAN